MSTANSVQIRVMRAEFLRAVNLVKGNSDPYAVLSIPRSTETHTTTVCLNTCNPFWYQNFFFAGTSQPFSIISFVSLNASSSTTDSPVPTCTPPRADVRTTDTLVVRLFDKNLVAGDRALGEVHISLAEALSKTAANLRKLSEQARAGPAPATASMPMPHVDLQHRLTSTYAVEPRGIIALVIVPVADLPDLAMVAPSNRFQRFQTHKFSQQVGNFGKMPFQNRVGVAVGHALHAGAERSAPLHAVLDVLQPVHSAFQEHSTWKIHMRGVVDVFGDKRHGWNRDYPAAQRIFQGKGSIVPRRAVMMQHAYLYGGASGIKPLVHMRKDMLEITGNLLDGKDFLRLMEDGVRRGRGRMFTYVLMPERLYMAETGAKFFRDMMSKHAMHCSASPEVVYAGELHFRPNADGADPEEVRLILDNNSGTYAPGKEDLPRVEEVFRRNFPGLSVTALDYKDPLLIQYRDQLLSVQALVKSA